MKRSAPTRHELLAPIRDRWSPRAFSERIPPRETLVRIFEAARWAPSAFNEQPWRFLLALKTEEIEFERMLSCLVEANAAWAAKAPVLAILSTSTHFQRNGKPNRHAAHDAGMALAQLILQATWEGLFVHPMAGFSRERTQELYGIPEDFEPVTALAMGYYGDPDDLDGDLRERELAPRERRPLRESLFTGNWGHPSALLEPES